MTQNTENSEQKHFIKCPFCPCLFLTQPDLQKHLVCMGDRREEHADFYRKTHGRMEHGSNSTE